MINFDKIDVNTFLSDFWQKKPLVIRNALPGFKNILSGDELAGLSLEEELESRIVTATPNKKPFWHLKKGPFVEADYQHLPPTHWTLLVQGVDRYIPELALLFDHFRFIPQWRVDDLMISYAVDQGSVGPHYDNYDVFLYQAQGRRKWSLTTQQCHEDNALPDVPLRIMQHFNVEEEYLLEEGDMLYLPAHVGHHGMAIGDDCMTYSFGYRSYSNRELWDSFGDYCAEEDSGRALYRDPSWTTLQATAELPRDAWLNAKALLQEMLEDEQMLKAWFGCFVTQLDPQAEALLPEPVSGSKAAFVKKCLSHKTMSRHPSVRFAYETDPKTTLTTLFINGCKWDTHEVSPEIIKLVANHREFTIEQLHPWFTQPANQNFLFELWTLQWIVIVD